MLDQFLNNAEELDQHDQYFLDEVLVETETTFEDDFPDVPGEFEDEEEMETVYALYEDVKTVDIDETNLDQYLVLEN